MILFIEGPRACGKTYLINELIASLDVDSNKNIEYYKFYFANHIKLLNLQHINNSPSLHYFSLGNIMTILEMNLHPEYKDKIWIFDRAIISAYAWAILMGRMSKVDAYREYSLLLESDLYANCKTLVVGINESRADYDISRNKDIFDGVHSTEEEMYQLANLVELGKPFLSDQAKNNSLSLISNTFDQNSRDLFIYECKKLLDHPA